MALYDRYASRVYGLALKMLGDPMMAEDVSQDAFVRLWNRAETYRPERGAFSTWILTITRRIAIDRLRMLSRRPEIAYSIDERDWETPVAKGSMASSDRWRTLASLIEDIPSEQRIVIELAYFFGLSHRQIAEHTSVPLGTVKTRIRLGLEKLREAWFDGYN